MRVWIQPFCQRTRCPNQFASSCGASSGVSEFEAGDPVAEAGEADAEIGVLGDVPFVPPARAYKRVDAEMIGGAAERDRQVAGRRGPD